MAKKARTRGDASLSHLFDSDKVSHSDRGCLAREALAKFNYKGRNDSDRANVPKKSYSFVALGPISNGYFRNRRIFHFNFTAKDKDDAAAPVETFFSEVTLDKHGSVNVDSVYRLAPTHTLPERAKTYDCVYCPSLNIHHPRLYLAFRPGREDHHKTLMSKIGCFNKHIKKGKRKREFSPKFSGPGFHYFGDKNLDPSDFIAKVALRKFNAQQEGMGANYEFVNVGLCKTIFNKYGFFMHMNFEAKTKENPQVQTFFAEVVIQMEMHYYFVSCCKCLGSSASLSLNDIVDCCYYCRGKLIHHPPGPGYLTGRIDNNFLVFVMPLAGICGDT